MLLLVSLGSALLCVLIGTIVGFSMGVSALLAVPVLAFAGYAVFRCARYLAARLESKDLFSPLVAFPIAYVIWFSCGLLGLPDEAVRKIGMYAALGLASYLLGSAVVGRKPGRASSESVASHNEWDRAAFFRVMGGLSVLAGLSYLYIVAGMGVPALDPNAGELRLAIVNYGAAEAVLFTSAYTVLLFLTAYLWSPVETGALRASGCLWMGLVSLALLSLGSRGFLAVPLVTAVIARHYVRKRFRTVSLAAVGLVLFVVLGLYGYTRDTLLSSGSLTIGAGDTIQEKLFPFVYLYVYVLQPVDALQRVTEIIPREVGYQHGELTLGALRTLLPGHHEMSDMFFKKILGSDFIGGGEPATLLGPFYGDFGVPGIILGMFFLGMLLGRLYAWMRSRPTLFRVLIYSWGMQTALFSLFGAIFPYITTLWIPFFWWVLDSRVLRRSPIRSDFATSAWLSSAPVR
jgi:oligosaccharide repeat unit polymerase